MGAGTAVARGDGGSAAAGALGAGQPRDSATLAAGAVASVVGYKSVAQCGFKVRVHRAKIARATMIVAHASDA